MPNERIEIEFNFVQFMQDIREKSGETTLRPIARRIGDVSASTLSRIENHNLLPDMRTFMHICSSLSLNPEDYFQRTIWVKKPE